MENIQEMRNQTGETSRRRFLTDSAKKAAWVAPALTLMMAASATPAHAVTQYDNQTQTTTTSKPHNGYEFWKVWCQVHRGRSS